MELSRQEKIGVLQIFERMTEEQRRAFALGVMCGKLFKEEISAIEREE